MKLDYIFFNIETSDIDPTKGEIIDIAAIRTDNEGTIIVPYADRIKPLKPVSEEAAKVNGYTESDWEGAITFDRAYDSMVATILEGRSNQFVVVAHYAMFAQAYLKSECDKIKQKVPFESRTWVDTFHLVWPVYADELIPNRSLKAVAEYYGVNTNGPHSAMSNVELLHAVYWRMMKRFHLVNNAESTVRKVGSSILDAAMGMMNGSK